MEGCMQLALRGGDFIYITMDSLRSIPVELRPSIDWRNECALLANIATTCFGELAPGLASGPLQTQMQADDKNGLTRPRLGCPGADR